MSYPLTDYDKKQIAKLPADIAALAQKYPCEIVNVVEAWDDKPFPSDYIPQYIETYIDAGDEPSLRVLEGSLTDYIPAKSLDDIKTIQVIIDGKFAYIEIESRVIIDHIGGVVFPAIATNPVELMQILTKE
ncbi:hypothetical protein [Nostoc sp.]|uniref:hypothetical protein n=1 Tax=Nostoc sp. TaxID=1180 RepID=UPI0035937C64